MSKAFKHLPSVPGRYQARCAESNGEWYFVRVYRRADLVLMARDEHMGDVGLTAYHDGLTDLEWRKL